MADRLVDLQLHLTRVEHQGRDLARALGRGEQRHGLGTDTFGLLDQAQRADVLVAGRLHVSAERVRVAAPLHVTVGDRDGLDAAARVRDHLLDRGAVARSEPGRAAEEVEAGLGEGESGHALHHARGLHQQGDLLLERHGEGVLLHGRAPRGRGRVHRRQRDRVAGQALRGFGHLDGEPRGAGDLGVIEPSGGGEAPAPAHQHPDPDARRRRAVDALHLLVADGERLALVGPGARIGEVGARRSCGVDGHLRDVEHASLPPVRNVSAPGRGPGRRGASYPVRPTDTRSRWR